MSWGAVLNKVRRVRATGTAGGCAGFTVTETVVALGIGALVIGLVIVSMGSFFQLGTSSITQGQASSDASLAIQEMQRQVVAANVIFNPTTATQAAKAGTEPTGSSIPVGFSLLVLTTAKGTPWKARYPVFTDIKQEGDFARAY